MTPVVRPPDPRRTESAADGGDLHLDADVAASDGGGGDRRTRRAHAMHAAIKGAVGPCRDCGYDLRSRAVVVAQGCRTEVWAFEDIEQDHAAVRIAGRFETCRLARFLPNMTCHRVAEYLVDWG